jgi:glycerate 2-kinase
VNTYFKKILEEIKPEKLYAKALSDYFQNSEINFNQFEKVSLFAIGKAASLEAKYFMGFVKNKHQVDIEEFLIITKENHGLEEFKDETFESSHPYVTAKSFEASSKSFDFIQKRKEGELLIALISGGSSALIESYDEKYKNQLVEKFNEVIDSGINIDELNHLRKSFSKVKNGRLLAGCKAEVLSLLTSDIPDNNPFLIGSSPTLFEKIDEQKKSALIEKYNFSNIPQEKESEDLRLKDNFHLLIRYENLIPICQKYSNGKIRFRQSAYNTSLDDGWEKYLCEIDLDYLNISFGEFNIEVSGSGKGGRNTHFVLFMANKVFKENYLKLSENELNSLVIFSIGTDGGDGPTDAAGAWIDMEKYTSLKPHEYLNNFDSYSYFEKVGSLIKTGPTGTNLMDLRGIGTKDSLLIKGD